MVTGVILHRHKADGA